MTEPDEPRDDEESRPEPGPDPRMFAEAGAFACEGDSCALPVVPPED